MKPGDILRVKISGETVQILKKRRPEERDMDELGEITLSEFLVRRAVATRDGVDYVLAQFREDELEPVEANIDREFREAIYRSNLMRSGLVIRQQAQEAGSEQLDLFDDDDEEPEEGPLN